MDTVPAPLIVKRADTTQNQSDHFSNSHCSPSPQPQSTPPAAIDAPIPGTTPPPHPADPEKLPPPLTHVNPRPAGCANPKRPP